MTYLSDAREILESINPDDRAGWLIGWKRLENLAGRAAGTVDSGFRLSARSVSRLAGVHPDLVAVVERAIRITEVDFAVTEGLRTNRRQAQLFDAGKSRTLNSRHLTGHAVDLAAWVAGTISWEWQYYEKIAAAMKEAARQLSVPIEWGGDWKSFRDGPHFQLSRAEYPASHTTGA